MSAGADPICHSGHTQVTSPSEVHSEINGWTQWFDLWGSLPVVALLTGFINQMLVGIWNYFFVIITFLLQMIIFMIFKRCTRNQFGNASSQHIQSWAHWTLTNVLLKKLLVFVAGLMPHWLSHWRTVLHTFKSKDSIFKML